MRRLKNSLTWAGPLGENLNAAFAEVGDAKLENFADLFRGGGFGDGDERDLGRIAPWP
jgi:hypothetical protein